MAQPKRTQLRHFVPGHHCPMQWLHNSTLARPCSEYKYIYIYRYRSLSSLLSLSLYILYIYIYGIYIWIFAFKYIYIYMYFYTHICPIYVYRINVYTSMSVCLHLSLRPTFWDGRSGVWTRGEKMVYRFGLGAGYMLTCSIFHSMLIFSCFPCLCCFYLIFLFVFFLPFSFRFSRMLWGLVICLFSYPASFSDLVFCLIFKFFSWCSFSGFLLHSLVFGV